MFRDFYRDAEILHGLVSRLQHFWMKFEPNYEGLQKIEGKYRIDGNMLTISIKTVQETPLNFKPPFIVNTGKNFEVISDEPITLSAGTNWNPGGGEDTVYEIVGGRCRVK